MAALHQACLVASPNRLKEGTGGYRPIVDQDVNVIAFSTRNVRCADPTAPALSTRGLFIIGRVLERNEFCGLCPHDVIQSVEHIGRAGYVEERTSFGFQMKPTLWVSKSVVHDRINDSCSLGFGTSLEGQPRRCISKEVFD